MTTSETEQKVPETVTVETRFGDIEFFWNKAIYMPVGLLGFAEHHAFGLANIPGSTLDQFKLYQSLTDANLSFIISPYNPDANIYSAEDIERALGSLAIPQEDMVILLVVTIRPSPSGTGIAMSVNLQAPIIIDTKRQVGWQHIMAHDKYPVQHDI
ncbi:flagellar assembly protein FliW [Thalassospira sp.]|uniref:flagellar assembly protein FliW n=1 Tax=Thalassospira sp. TaxID=1912094 RepID=UPI00273497EB|nr:flagellar assembly protein FliW [Thalassospira sp.]MDP2696660.1 flagellar assembly protein FliW [Thalassospira sp.]